MKLKEGQPLGMLENIQFDYDKAIFDDFTNGVNFDTWNIANQAWGPNNGGCIPENVSYTDDGYLILKSNGAHYNKGEVSGVGAIRDGRKTGSCLISKFIATPGRYESRFKPTPRLGACTAMWTYAYRSNYGANADNHEIDIELPGGSTTGTVTFQKGLFTNWTTETLKISQDKSMSEMTQGHCINLNDGNFHTFGFDWYTNPELVVYFVDGYIVAMAEGFVPTLSGRLWLGNWFPESFVGSAEFESSQMIVDWFKFIPFKDQPYEQYEPSVGEVAIKSQYPSSPSVLSEDNWISNGDFEYINRVSDKAGYGWFYTHTNRKPKDGINYDADVVSGVGVNDSAAAVLNKNAYLSTFVDSVYEGYKFNFKFDYKTEGSGDGLTARILYQNVTGTTIKTDSFTLKGSEWNTKEIEVSAPADCAKFKIEFYNVNNEDVSYLDNVSMYRK